MKKNQYRTSTVYPSDSTSTRDSTEVPTKRSRVSHNNKVPPDAPRRNLSSFVMFANHRRNELKKSEPDPSYPDLQKQISREWRVMDSTTKERWRRAMEADKGRYKREMDLYRKYAQGWVWVVGHRMRQELGLRDEDCTTLKWDDIESVLRREDTSAQSTTGRNDFPDRGINQRCVAVTAISDGLGVHGFDYEASAIDLTTEEYANRRQRSYDSRVSPTLFVDPNPRNATFSSPTQLVRRPETNDCWKAPKSTNDVEYWDEFFDPEEEIIAPTVFDGFGFEIP